MHPVCIQIFSFLLIHVSSPYHNTDGVYKVLYAFVRWLSHESTVLKFVYSARILFQIKKGRYDLAGCKTSLTVMRASINMLQIT